jgi:SRSO17 transposase
VVREAGQGRELPGRGLRIRRQGIVRARRRAALPAARMAKDPVRRAKAKNPATVTFQKTWVLADEMLRQVGPRLLHKWIVADSEYGRSSLFRDRLAKRAERYMREVPSNISVRKVAGRPAAGRSGTG